MEIDIVIIQDSSDSDQSYDSFITDLSSLIENVNPNRTQISFENDSQHSMPLSWHVKTKKNNKDKLICFLKYMITIGTEYENNFWFKYEPTEENNIL